jgi:hypothetical protein
MGIYAAWEDRWCGPGLVKEEFSRKEVKEFPRLEEGRWLPVVSAT